MPPPPPPPVSGYPQSLKRPLSSFDWHRFDYYAAFIKSLGSSQIGRSSMEWSPQVSLALQHRRSCLGSPLLPNLKEFSWCGDVKPDAIFSVAIFLPPTLKHIFINPERNMLWTQAFLSYFPQASPGVENISIGRFGRTNPVDIRPVLGCFHLRSLSISGVRVSNVESALKLAGLPHLEDLTLFFIHRSASTDPSPHQSNPSIFRRVKSLSCNGSPEFLHASRFPVLQSFSTEEEFRIRDSLNALWKHCSPDILCKLSIDFTSTEHFTWSLTMEDIRNTFNFRRLEQVTFVTPRWIWNDQALKLMASAWSGLRKLTIQPLSTRNEDSVGFPLLGLIHLVKCCPQLMFLSIRISERNPPISLSDLPEDGPSNHHIESIWFSGAIMEQSQYGTVAAFLSCLFPNLRQLIVSPTDPGFDGWKSIEGLLENFAAVRAYPRRG